jgi:signal transduction histidine kinase
MGSAVVRAAEPQRVPPRALMLGGSALIGGAAACAVAFHIGDAPVRAPDTDSFLRGLAVVLYVAVGTYTTWRRPRARFGYYLTGIGLFFAVASLSASHHQALHTVGRVAFAGFSVCLSYVFLVFPHDRLASDLERRVIGTFVVVSVASWAVTVPLLAELPPAGPLTDCGSGCPGNAFQVTHVSHGVETTLVHLVTYVTAVNALAVAMLLVAKARSHAHLRHRLVGPLLVCACVQVFNFALYIVLRQLDVAPTEGLKVLGTAAALAVPGAMLVGQLRGRVFVATSLGQLVARAGVRSVTPERVERMLRLALGDPTLRLALWEPARDAYIDVSGRAVELPQEDGNVTATLIEREGRNAAALIHDASLVEESDIAEGLAATSLLLLDHTALVEELHASRRRIVVSAHHERLRLERDLHDGAQQRLFAIQIKLDAARDQVQDDRLGRELDEISADAAAAVAELRALAHGLYPTLLRERGLPDALRSLAHVAAIPMRVVDEDIGRCSHAVEEAVYFCALEAIQNTTKHAGAGAHVTITLARREDDLDVTIVDDGLGFDLAVGGEGIGLVNMRDRIGAVGGELEIVSAPRIGTTIRAHLPQCAATNGD